MWKTEPRKDSYIYMCVFIVCICIILNTCASNMYKYNFACAGEKHLHYCVCVEPNT